MRFTSPHRCCLVRSAWSVLGVVSLSLPNLSAALALKITSHPLGATVKRDGVPAGTTPLERNFPGNAPANLKLAADSHVVVLKSAGFPDYTRTIEIPKASKLTWKAVFQTAGSP
jgi:hypothetical protein